MTLTGFVAYLRDHGWPCSVESAKRMIEAGVFAPACYVCPGLRKGMNGDMVPTKDYVIIPKRLDRWFHENADEVRRIGGETEQELFIATAEQTEGK